MDYSIIKNKCDCVVMLTQSNWNTEPISNRYHYATRFSRILPVLFVQPDLTEPTYSIENTKHPNIFILHVYKRYGVKQTRILKKAIADSGYSSPLLWILNAFLVDYYRSANSPIKICHTTEDYFTFSSMYAPKNIEARLRCLFIKLASYYTDLVVSVTELYGESYLRNTNFKGKHIVIENGCDFDVWGLREEEIDEITSKENSPKTIIYQGGVNDRLDYDMLLKLCPALPEWTFIFCGIIKCKIQENNLKLNKLKELTNTNLTGQLTISEVRDFALKSSIGWMPFINAELMRVNLPLKAFEYVANGLPVITTCPIISLERYGDLFCVCTTIDELKAQINELYKTRYDRDCIDNRIKAAKSVSYDDKFECVVSTISDMLAADSEIVRATKKASIVKRKPNLMLILVCQAWLFIDSYVLCLLRRKKQLMT